MQEIERKYLVADESWRAEVGRSMRVAQGYLCSRKLTARVRICDDRGILTFKGKSRDGGLSRFEFEREIPRRVAELLLCRCDGVVDKVRHLVEVDGHTFEVDEFQGENEGLIVAEVELSSVTERVTLPSWIGDEVTGERCFYNSFLSKHPFKSWTKR
ncbi:MAG: CYTH domain-containing protein [Alistipes sp.]|nr:CYTH domain-containing protein [Alistipes sp.]